MRLSVWWLAGVMLLAGCAGEKKESFVGAKIGGAKKDKAMDRAPAGAVPAAAQAPAADGAKGDGGKKEAKAKADQRKIIYRGEMELVVEDLDKASAELLTLLEEQGGYVADSSVSGQPHRSRTGRWTLRVPSARFTEFFTALLKLGERQNQQTKSDDITESYFDTKAEVKNLEVEEDTLRKLLAKVDVAGSKVADILEVKRELARVRNEINIRMARLQRWDKLVEYATITLTLHEREGYVPPESPGFSTTIGRTFSSSITALKSTGEAFVLVMVALAPWLGVLAVLGLAVYLPVRFFSRPRRRLPKVIPAPPPPPDPSAITEG